MIKNRSFACVCCIFPPGERDQRIGEQEARAARAVHGGDYGHLLPPVLAAVRDHGPAGHLRAAGPGHARGQHHPLIAGQDEHGHQPCHLCLHE